MFFTDVSGFKYIRKHTENKKAIRITKNKDIYARV